MSLMIKERNVENSPVTRSWCSFWLVSIPTMGRGQLEVPLHLTQYSKQAPEEQVTLPSAASGNAV